MKPRFVHAVTVLGNPENNWADSVNWTMTLGDRTGSKALSNPEKGRFINYNWERVGKEMKVGAMGKVLAFYRKDYAADLTFISISIFSTDSDCTAPFVWSNQSTVQIDIGTTNKF